MKRRILIITLSVLLVLIVGSLCLISALTLGFSEGRCLVAENGTVLLVKGKEPIVLSQRGVKMENLATGDRIFVIHGGVQETYPAGTGAWLVLRLEGGSVEDIPEDVIARLTEMGWKFQ